METRKDTLREDTGATKTKQNLEEDFRNRRRAENSVKASSEYYNNNKEPFYSLCRVLELNNNVYFTLLCSKSRKN